ncbi:MAG: ABC transporter ATP-binding protein [Clostridia bacterium]|nr:ABC transporter ATP-binding protein [Clostridia bacterium]
MSTPIIEAQHLSKTFSLQSDHIIRRNLFAAVSDVSFAVYPGETFGIVGESGCGKSTIAKMLMCLESPTSGEILFNGNRIDNLTERARRPIRTRFQMVFQDSGTTLNPRKTIGDLLREPMLYHHIQTAGCIEGRIDELLQDVGLSKNVKNRYPHEFSGGQRQRICIARALSVNPELIVLDEPVSALDVSVQAQILNLLQTLQAKNNLTYIFISHGLGAVRYISHRIAVMYRGRFVETGSCASLFTRPAHPYTRALIDAAPSVDEAALTRKKLLIEGEVGDEIPEGACPLIRRCPLSHEACTRFLHHLSPIPNDHGHESACLRALEANHG